MIRIQARDLVQNAGNSLVRRADREKEDHLYQIIAYFLRNNCKERVKNYDRSIIRIKFAN